MILYEIVLSDKAEQDLIKLAKSEPKAYKKAIKLIQELEEHPKTGTGKPEVLKGFDGDVYSRRITQKHRLVYRIVETEIIVNVVSSYGHYDD